LGSRQVLSNLQRCGGLPSSLTLMYRAFSSGEDDCAPARPVQANPTTTAAILTDRSIASLLFAHTLHEPILVFRLSLFPCYRLRGKQRLVRMEQTAKTPGSPRKKEKRKNKERRESMARKPSIPFLFPGALGVLAVNLAYLILAMSRRYSGKWR
jgi:hypothetical protein